MFSNAYQNGTHIQVFDSKVNSEKNQFYKQLYKTQPNSIKKYFDKQVKSYLYEFQGLNAKISFPSDDHKQLSLHQRYLVLQLHIPIGSSWSMEISMTDISKTKRRINLATMGKQQSKYFFFRYPVPQIEKGVWLFLAIDVISFMQVFKGQVFRSLDHIVVGSSCRLRRIFTMKQWNQYDIPNSYWLPGEITQQMQLIQYASGKQKEGNMILSQPAQQVSRIKDITPKKLQKQYDHNLRQKNSKPNNSPFIKGKSVENSVNSLRKSPSKQSDHFIINGIGKNERLKGLQINNYPNSMVKSQISHQIKNKARVNTMHENEKVSKSEIHNLKSNRINTIWANKKQAERKIERRSINRSQSKNKAPILQKSFQEDQALMVSGQDSEIPYIQSKYNDEGIQPLAKQQQIEQDKWSDQQGSLSKEQTVSTPFTEHLQNMSNGFPGTTITKQNNNTVIMQNQKQQGNNQIELIYDQMVGCYYHPETNTYYQINQ